MGPHLRPNAVTPRDSVRMSILLKVCVLGSLSAAVLALKCYKCDGVKGQDLPCDGASGKGKEVDCDDKCGLLLESRLPLDRHGNVIGGDYRWRRGCATDGHEITANSGAQPRHRHPRPRLSH